MTEEAAADDIPSAPDADAVDRAHAADVLLAEAHISLERTGERANRIETKASWLISGLVPSFTVIAVGVVRQACDIDLNDPIDVALLAIGATIVFLLALAH